MLTLLLAVTLAALDADPPPPVAMVLAAPKGEVTLERDGTKPRRLRATDLLRPGDRLRAATGASALLIFLDEGRYERLKPNAQATVGDKGCTPADAVEPVAGRKLPPAQLEGLRDLARSSRGAVAVVRGRPPATPQAVTPLYDATVLTDRPALTWRPADKADSYQVQMWSGDGQRLIWREKTTAARLDYPPKQAGLKPGTQYRWRVTVRRGEDEDPTPLVDSKFATAGKEEAEELAAVKPLAASAEEADLLLAAVTYQAYGAYGEALALYEKLAAKEPEEPSFQLALASYYERAGRADQAEAARAKAKKLGAEVPEP
jgi:hypothetical protein